jgi:hypothetical protein
MGNEEMADYQIIDDMVASAGLKRADFHVACHSFNRGVNLITVRFCQRLGGIQESTDTPSLWRRIVDVKWLGRYHKCASGHKEALTPGGAHPPC